MRVPAEATRLFLGFAEARGQPATGVTGPPGFYANNRGELEVTLQVRSR